jgi:hypothetical protein
MPRQELFSCAARISYNQPFQLNADSTRIVGVRTMFTFSQLLIFGKFEIQRICEKDHYS